MAGVKRSDIAVILRDWIQRSGRSQAEIARQLKIAPSVLSRQLQGKESLPLPRIESLIKLLSPAKSEVALVYDLIQRPSGDDATISRESTVINESVVRDIESVAHTYSHSDGITFTLQLEREPYKQWILLDYVAQSNIIAGIFQGLRKQLFKEKK